MVLSPARGVQGGEEGMEGRDDTQTHRHTDTQTHRRTDTQAEGEAEADLGCKRSDTSLRSPRAYLRNSSLAATPGGSHLSTHRLRTRERERERERETERQRDRQTDGQTDRQTETETETDTTRDRERERDRDTESGSHRLKTQSIASLRPTGRACDRARGGCCQPRRYRRCPR